MIQTDRFFLETILTLTSNDQNKKSFDEYIYLQMYPFFVDLSISGPMYQSTLMQYLFFISIKKFMIVQNVQSIHSIVWKVRIKLLSHYIVSCQCPIKNFMSHRLRKSVSKDYFYPTLNQHHRNISLYCNTRKEYKSHIPKGIFLFSSAKGISTDHIK